ncbi:MAG: RNA 2',3'-cyclic phosphodiesterase [Candidatus Omnitrophica bacterium]|nr:RNA 2',3'-cyclic phosphodiesterase [Candidatus Omnitrophota bacterium]
MPQRAFIGIALPSEARAVLEALCVQLRPRMRHGRWVGPEAMHVTLKFLGTITPQQRDDVEVMIRTVASREPAFQLGLGAAGAFPSLRAARVIWVGVTEGEEAVCRLAEALEQGARALGLPAEERPFSAHVTLGRAPQRAAIRGAEEALRGVVWQPPAPWKAGEVTLYQSHLSSAGARYEALAVIPLGTSFEERPRSTVDSPQS